MLQTAGPCGTQRVIQHLEHPNCCGTSSSSYMQHSPINICLPGVPHTIGTRRRIRTPPVGADVADAVCVDLAHTCHATLPVAHCATVGVTLVVIPHSVGAGGSLPANATRADPSGAVLRQEGNITVSRRCTGG
jgi:hypothetical protein